MPVTLDQIRDALTSQARPTEPVVAPVVVYGLAVAGAGAVGVAAVGVAQSAADRLAESGVGRGLARITPDLEQLGAGGVPGEVGMLPMWKADP